MKCLFIPDHSHDEENILLKGDDFHHIVKAHRLKTGEKLELKDSSFAYSCVTSNIRNDAVVFTILEKRILIPPTLNLTLCQAILKGDSFSFVLQKATELGVSKIIPYMAERSVVSIPPEEEDKKIVRWRKICEEAAKQCGRDNIPSVTEVNRDLGLLKCPADNRLVAYELENAHSLKDRLNQIHRDSEITLVVGPEGGLSEREIKLATGLGFMSCSLSQHTLRAETAALSMISNIFYHFSQ